MQCIREELRGLRTLRMQLGGGGGGGSTGSAGGAAMDGFVDILRDWEREGWGWVTEVEGGVIYLGMGKRKDEVAMAVNGEE